MTKESLQEFQEYRGVPEWDLCPRCNGIGIIWYGSTATWKGGAGGAAMTRDVCNLCWGSGSKSRIWPSHKEFARIKRQLEKQDKK